MIIGKEGGISAKPNFEDYESVFVIRNVITGIDTTSVTGWIVGNPTDSAESILTLEGTSPWTVDYAIKYETQRGLRISGTNVRNKVLFQAGLGSNLTDLINDSVTQSADETDCSSLTPAKNSGQLFKEYTFPGDSTVRIKFKHQVTFENTGTVQEECIKTRLFFEAFVGFKEGEAGVPNGLGFDVTRLK